MQPKVSKRTENSRRGGLLAIKLFQMTCLSSFGKVLPRGFPSLVIHHPIVVSTEERKQPFRLASQSPLDPVG